MMADIEPGATLNFPINCKLVGDKGYANRYPIITPFRQNQILLHPANEQPGMMMYNREINSIRIFIEHVIRVFKIYHVIGQIFSHPRHLMGPICDICGFLVQRHVKLFNELH